MIIILDFGSQYTQLIARRIRECKVYSEIYSGHYNLKRILAKNPEGIILSGGPGSVYDMDPRVFRPLFESGRPILGICYGMQLAAEALGGKVRRCPNREYGPAIVKISPAPIFDRLPPAFKVWMSHGDSVIKLPAGARVIARTDTTPHAGFQYRNFYGLQFHPEVRHTRYGIRIINNFLTLICRARKNWNMERFIQEKVREIRETVGRDKVICAISGGVDSTVAATLTARAIGKNLIGIFVDNGLLRWHEKEEVRKSLMSRVNLKVVDAEDRFLRSLKNALNPERKRKIIGHEFIKVFEAEARKYKGVKYLVQGTLYPDVIESGQGIGPADVIKSHHNVGGLPQRMKLKIIEPLRMLFKDEVRLLGRKLGLPEAYIRRKPFPGPGLAVRVVGRVERARLNVIRQADRILLEEARKLKGYKDIWQIFTVLLPLGSVGVMGDKRTYDAVCAIRAVFSEDGMTADWVRLPHRFLAVVSSRITNEVKGINRIVYDISSKPPATIEWE
jgi:GMP synthase (glutamine-hydrolysing)